MEEFEMKRYEQRLYGIACGIPIEGDARPIWDEVRGENEILRAAMQVRKNKWNEDTVAGPMLCKYILAFYDEVDPKIYQDFVNLIYSNREIARTVLGEKSSYTGTSYLLLTLMNHDLKLTESQKQFAVSEAMKKIGTVSYQKSVGKDQAHGYRPYDIRYHILMNPNWEMEEKANLIYDFYKDDCEYDETLEEWEWGIVNGYQNRFDLFSPAVDKDQLYEVTYSELLDVCTDQEKAASLYEEMTMCKLFHEMRPQQWEIPALDKVYQKK